MGKNNGGPAFPTLDYRTPDRVETAERGMTLRDFFAAKAMQAIMSSTVDEFIVGVGYENNNLSIAMCSYSVADAMLKARD